MVIILMGPQGSGKTTQANRLAEAFGIPHLESGEAFREVAEEDSDLGRRVRDSLSKGQLVNVTDADAIIESMFEKAKYHNHVIVDGFPRDLDQAKRHTGHIDRIFYLDVPEEECIKRLASRGRADDTPEVIHKRLEQYYQRTVPVLEYFEQKAIVERIKADRSADEIFTELHDRLKRMLQIGEVELMD
jgi:adenylate kinase